MKKMIFTLFVLLICLGSKVYADDAVTERFVATMKMERDRAVVRLLKLWLNKAPEKVLEKEVLVLVTRETYLASTAPVASVNDLYLYSSDGFIKENLPFSIFMIFFKREGVDLHPISFFEGKRFRLIKRREKNK